MGDDAPDVPSLGSSLISRRELGGVVGGNGDRDSRFPARVFPRGMETAGPLSSYPAPYSPHRVSSGTAGRVLDFGLVPYAGHSRLVNAYPDGVTINSERSDDVTSATSPSATAPQGHPHPTALREHLHAPLLPAQGHPTVRGPIPRGPAILATRVFSPLRSKPALLIHPRTTRPLTSMKIHATGDRKPGILFSVRRGE
jgi:hypothetical protein